MKIVDTDNVPVPPPATRPLAIGDLKPGDVVQWTDANGNVITELVTHCDKQLHGVELSPDSGTKAECILGPICPRHRFVRYPDAKLVLGQPQTEVPL